MARKIGIPLVIGVLAMTGCSMFGNDQGPAAVSLERTTLRVGVGNVIDTAPLRLAVQEGRFVSAGLRVDLVEQGQENTAIGKLAAGELDVAFASDVALFRAAAGGTALQLQGEAYTAGPNTMALVTLPSSKYPEPAAKKSPTIAVNMLDDLGSLAAKSTLGTAGVDPKKIHFEQRPFDQMAQALTDGEVDAAWMVEPYITRAEKELGARILADGAAGATLDFPVSGYASSGMFAQANPKTLALFRLVLSEAQQRADDPAVVRGALPKFSDIDATTASLIALGTYPATLNGIRLQRVADLMHNEKLINDRLDVMALLPGSGRPS
ncbi:ABC transporter substrate-binding protein [Amycolatopsis sp. NPDC059657]|uniref:ABC transporter substrate-binding protein n=1 Tax=Amycolatopsis sp. NPDC059657 TaxID=3346899 RepID=UPI0036736264